MQFLTFFSARNLLDYQFLLQVLQLQSNEDDQIKLKFSESSKGKMPLLSPAILPVTMFGRSLNRRLDDLILSYVIWGTEGSSLYRQLLLPAASVVIALMSITALTPQAVVVIVLEVVDVEVELVVTLAITALTPQTALSAVTHHWSRVVGRNQPTCPTYTGGGSRKQTRTGSILSQDEEK